MKRFRLVRPSLALTVLLGGTAFGCGRLLFEQEEATIVGGDGGIAGSALESPDAGWGAGSGGTTSTGGSGGTASLGGSGGVSNTAGSGSGGSSAGTGGSASGGTTSTGTGYCGDGVVDTGEDCDDGSESATCNADCTTATCGDGVPNTSAGEQCDDAGESASCNADCTTATCGDGVVNSAAGEICDDSGESATCDSDCTAPACGDGVTNGATGEQCDDAGPTATCDTDCTLATCGDSTLNTLAGEQCDEGGESATCRADCTAVNCGNGVVDAFAGEECDDSGESASCNANCTLALCGDGVANSTAGEDCDDSGESATCNSNCSTSSCGDGIVNTTAGEQCEPSLDAGCLGSCQFGYTASLIHRFSFDESGDTFNDTVGSASGSVSGTLLQGNGDLSLPGAGEYATVSPGILSSLVSATFEVWLTWQGSSSWERVFDFGSAQTVAGPSGDEEAKNYFALTPMNDTGGLRVALSDGPRNADVVVALGFPLPTSTKTHVAVVVDDAASQMRLYLNGALQGSANLVIGLSAVTDESNYFGRSQFTHDPAFAGILHEFRIYDAALTDAQVLESYNAGEDL